MDYVRTYLIFMWNRYYPVGGIRDLQFACHGTIDDAMMKARDFVSASPDKRDDNAVEIVEMRGPPEAPTFRPVLRCDPVHFDLRWDAPPEQEPFHG
jgi:hypothetical protein